MKNRFVRQCRHHIKDQAYLAQIWATKSMGQDGLQSLDVFTTVQRRGHQAASLIDDSTKVRDRTLPRFIHVDDVYDNLVPPKDGTYAIDLYQEKFGALFVYKDDAPYVYKEKIAINGFISPLPCGESSVRVSRQG